MVNGVTDCHQDRVVSTNRRLGVSPVDFTSLPKGKEVGEALTEGRLGETTDTDERVYVTIVDKKTGRFGRRPEKKLV